MFKFGAAIVSLTMSNISKSLQNLAFSGTCKI